MADDTCSVPECGRRRKARGLCDTHLWRWYRYGSTDDPRRTPEQRFWAKVDKDGSAGCWLWTGRCNADGYGQFGIWGSQPRKVYAHRFAYELLVGQIPAGLQLDHLCRVRRCVNPAHLEPVTNRENSRRGEGFWPDTCRNGHHRTVTNTYIRRNGDRWCLDCRRERRKLTGW